MKQSLKTFIQNESTSGIVLFVAALSAVLVANSPLRAAYESALLASVGPLTVQAWINDGLMAIFFFIVGMEVKCELTGNGSLASFERAVLPVAGALGGMVVPAIIFLFFVQSGVEVRGWGIPIATDIAFALGVLSLFGRRIPGELKVFLLALAIADDLGAVLVIAVFYTTALHWLWMGASAVGIGTILVLRRSQVRNLWPYIAIGVSVWWCVHHSGLHATVAGCLLGFLVPHPRHWVLRLHGFSRFVVMPVFAFANCGLSFDGLSFGAALVSPLVSGISYGLVVGKPLGIFGASWLAVRLRLAKLGATVHLGQLFGVACLGGVGFTMSLFISGLALPAGLMDLARLGIVKGSLLSAIFGSVVLLVVTRTRQTISS